MKKKSIIAKHQKGFSFLEVMIVVAILAGLAAIVAPAIFKQLDRAKVQQTKVQIKSLENSLELYYLDIGQYPSDDQGLNALIQEPSLGTTISTWNGPYIKNKSLPKDAWNNDFTYSTEGSSFTITSLGGDGQQGGSNANTDISNNN